MDEPVILLTCIFDDFVQLPDGERISHSEYFQRTGNYYEPGPLRVKMDTRACNLRLD